MTPQEGPKRHQESLRRPPKRHMSAAQKVPGHTLTPSLVPKAPIWYQYGPKMVQDSLGDYTDGSRLSKDFSSEAPNIARNIKQHMASNPTSPLGREWFSSHPLPSNPLLPLRGGVYHCSLLINTPSPRRPGANPEP